MENFRTNRDLFNYLRENNFDISDFEALTNYIISSFNFELPNCTSEALKQRISNFTKTLKSRWLSSRYDHDKFIKKK